MFVRAASILCIVILQTYIVWENRFKTPIVMYWSAVMVADRCEKSVIAATVIIIILFIRICWYDESSFKFISN